MQSAKAMIKNAWPYQKDKMNLPVANVETAISFYEKIMGFKLISRSETPYPSAILERDEVQFGLSQNGGDPTQDGCFFEVDNVENAFAEFKANGLEKEISGFDMQTHGETKWKVFFIIAPDGLCYCIGEKV